MAHEAVKLVIDDETCHGMIGLHVNGDNLTISQVTFAFIGDTDNGEGLILGGAVVQEVGGLTTCNGTDGRSTEPPAVAGGIDSPHPFPKAVRRLMLDLLGAVPRGINGVMIVKFTASIVASNDAAYKRTRQSSRQYRSIG